MDVVINHGCCPTPQHINTTYDDVLGVNEVMLQMDKVRCSGDILILGKTPALYTQYIRSFGGS